MKRHRKAILLTLLFLLAGAVVNVAVAWAIAIVQPGGPITACPAIPAIPPGIPAEEWSPSLDRIPVHPPPNWLPAGLTLEQPPSESFRSGGLFRELEAGPGRIADWCTGTFDGPNTTTITLLMREEQIGWPWQAMVSTHAGLAAWDNAGDVVDPATTAPTELSRWVAAHNAGWDDGDRVRRCWAIKCSLPHDAHHDSHLRRFGPASPATPCSMPRLWQV